MPYQKHLCATLLLLVFLPCAALAQNATSKEDADLRAAGFVELTTLDPTILLDIRYATENNFTGQAVYPSARCYLQKPVAEKVARIQAVLKKHGLGLKVFDCYRPYRVQETFWKLVPDERYVAKPKRVNGKIIIGSRHNRGCAVDLTLVDGYGHELEMPTGFDDFSPKAKIDYSGGTSLSRANRDYLIDFMATEGFTPYPTEWWHYDAPGWEAYPMRDLPLPE